MGKDCACLSVVLVLECIAVRVGVRIRLYGQGLCLSLRSSGARVYCRAHHDLFNGPPGCTRYMLSPKVCI